MTDPNLPELWWSPIHGIMREKDGVWQHQWDNWTALRVHGLPNKQPKEAVRLLALTEQQPSQCEECETTGQNCRAHRNVEQKTESEDPSERLERLRSVARGVLGLPEQQPEPVGLKEFHAAMWASWKANGSHFGKVVTQIYDEFTITRKPEGADHGES